METWGLSEVEQLALFGDDQLLPGFGSPMEPDSFVHSPDMIGPDDTHNSTDTEQLAKKQETVPQTRILSSQDSPNGLEMGWMDRQHDIIGLLHDSSATNSEMGGQEISMYVPLPSKANQVEVVCTPNTAAEVIPSPPAENEPVVTQQLGAGLENDLLSEVFRLLDNIEDDAPDLQQLVNSLLSPDSVEEIESILSNTKHHQNDSGLESLASSCPGSPTMSMPSSPDPEYEPNESNVKKSRRGRRSAPYSKLPADKKERKKIQNKTAALKYRQKKKEEMKKVFTEVEMLEMRNKELKDKVDSLSNEIRYLKTLMQKTQERKMMLCSNVVCVQTPVH